MSRPRRVVTLALLLGGACALAGCSHYRITDTLTGKVYYTEGISLRERDATGAVYFEDAATGRQTAVLAPEVEKISGAQYKAALRQRVGVEPGTEGY